MHIDPLRYLALPDALCTVIATIPTNKPLVGLAGVVPTARLDCACNKITVRLNVSNFGQDCRVPIVSCYGAHYTCYCNNIRLTPASFN